VGVRRGGPGRGSGDSRRWLRPSRIGLG
jgi:hypothetical protein